VDEPADRSGVRTGSGAVDPALRQPARQPMTREPMTLEEALAMRGAHAIGQVPSDADLERVAGVVGMPLDRPGTEASTMG